MNNKKPNNINLTVPDIGKATNKRPITPNSPVTPTSPTQGATKPSLSVAISEIKTQTEEYKKNEEILSIIKQIGFHNAKKLCDTLQGMIWKANKTNKSGKIQSSVIKITNQFLHQNSTAIIKNQLYRVSENIVQEAEILKYLSQDKKCPNSIVKFEGFFHTNTDYWLIMKDGGSSLFDFVAKAHKLIKCGVITISQYKQLVIVIFAQMIECISYIHSKRVAHFDISLENFVINDVRIAVVSSDEKENNQIQKITFDVTDVTVQLCDFGLAHKFTKSDFVSNKHCGKSNYKSPEVFNESKQFLANANDVWCLGISLFILLTGGVPWKVAHESDNAFQFVQKHSILQLLKYWNIDKYMDKHFIVLFDSIFQYENERISLSEIHKYFYKFVWNV
eukprot:297380_1